MRRCDTQVVYNDLDLSETTSNRSGLTFSIVKPIRSYLKLPVVAKTTPLLPLRQQIIFLPFGKAKSMESSDLALVGERMVRLDCQNTDIESLTQNRVSDTMSHKRGVAGGIAPVIAKDI